MGGTSVNSGNMQEVGAGTNPYNAIAFTTSAIDNNPYVAAEAEDPGDALTETDEAISLFNDLVTTYVSATPDTDGEQQAFDDFIEKASGLFATYGIDVDTDLTAEVDAQEAAGEASYLRQRSAFEGAMFDINAIETTPYIIGLALIDNDHTRQLNLFRSQLLAQGRRDKNVFLIQAAELMGNMQTRNASLYQTLSSLKSERARLGYLTRREERMQNVEYDVGEIEWELETVKSGAQVIGAMQGIPLSPKKPSNLQTAVSAALSIGPQVGMGIGTATGNPMLGLLGGGLAAAFAYGSNING